jgi:hypothetical protein
MEIVMTITIVIALIALGAILSTGNERQRKAIQSLREQLEAWAAQDIRLKREKLSREVHVTDARAWLEAVAGQILGSIPHIQSVETWSKDDVTALVASCQDGQRLIFTPARRNRFLQVCRIPKTRLTRMETGLLGDHPKKVENYELSILTCGMFFDLEASQAWQQLSGQTLPGDHLFMYVIKTTNQ